MKKIIGIVLVIIISSISTFAQTAVKDEQEAVKKVIQSAYVDGLINNADQKAIAEGFHEGFRLIGIGKGNSMWNYPIYNWAEDARLGKLEGKYPKKGDEKVTVKYLFVDVEGTAASVKLEFYVGKEKKYIDYLSLYKFEDGWKIVSKTFYSFPNEEK
jgi:hypothetical protein